MTPDPPDHSCCAAEDIVREHYAKRLRRQIKSYDGMRGLAFLGAVVLLVLAAVFRKDIDSRDTYVVCAMADLMIAAYAQARLAQINEVLDYFEDDDECDEDTADEVQSSADVSSGS